AAECEIVLRAAVDVVERSALVDGDVIELGYGQVGHEVPVGAAVEALVDAAIAADTVVLCILWIDPDNVVVDVAPLLAEAAQRPAAVVAHLHVDAHDVDAVGIFRVDVDAGEVHGALIEVVAPFPGLAAIGRAKHATLLVDGFDAGVDDVRIDRCDGEG